MYEIIAILDYMKREWDNENLFLLNYWISNREKTNAEARKKLADV